MHIFLVGAILLIKMFFGLYSIPMLYLFETRRGCMVI
jgi:hypothetical protein